MRGVSVGFVAAMAAALVLVPSASAQEVLDANCPGPPETGVAGITEAAQTFTAQSTGALTRVQASISDTAANEGDFVLSIRTLDGSGTPTDSTLATTVVPDAAAPTPADTISGTFAAPANVVAGQRYALVISRPGDSFSALTRAEDPCPGALFVRVSIASPFTEVVGDDLVFAVFVTPPTPVSATCKGEQATRVGTEGNDEITGTAGRDVIAGLGGSDEVRGLAGKDLICGGKGKDTLRGGKAKDRLYGQGGGDKLAGGGGKDTCVGGKKDDTAKKCEVEKSI